MERGKEMEKDGKKSYCLVYVYVCMCYCKNECVKMILGIRENFECDDTLEDYVSCV